MSARRRAVAVGWGVLQLCVVGGAVAADGQAPAAPTRWGCSVADAHLVCFLDRSAPAAPVLPPRDPRLPTIVHELRHRPALWRGRTVRIPLHNEPFPDSPLRELAQAVLCGPQADCEAVIGLERWSNQSAWLEFADAQDPLLQHGD